MEEVIRKLVQNPKFSDEIRKKINSKIDINEMEQERDNLTKQLHQLNGAKNKLGQQMDRLDISDKFDDKKYQDMQDRLSALYEEIDAVEESIAEVQIRMENVQRQKMSGDNVYQFLLYFDKLYDKFTDVEKKTFLGSFIE